MGLTAMSFADPRGGCGAFLPRSRPARLPEGPEGGSHSNLTPHAHDTCPCVGGSILQYNYVLDYNFLFLGRHSAEKVFKTKMSFSALSSLGKLPTTPTPAMTTEASREVAGMAVASMAL